MADGPKIINKLRAMLGVTWLVYFHPSSTTGHVSGNGVVQEYCQWETFTASCDDGSVVLMKYARYGRMRFGRCMKEDHGSVGCSADVIKHLDHLCSGRRHCQLNLPDPSLHSLLNCPKEIMPYLEASYLCVKVQRGGNQACPIFGSVPLKSTSGNLLLTVPLIDNDDDDGDDDNKGEDDDDDDDEGGISYQSSSSHSSMISVMAPGSPFCPWFIEARPGQRVNLTLFTFHQNLQTVAGVNNQRSSSSSSRSCMGSRLVVKDTKTSLEFDVCSRDKREIHLMNTINHPVKIFIYPTLPRPISPLSSSSSPLSFTSFSHHHHHRIQQQLLLFQRRRRRDLLLEERSGNARDLLTERPIGLVRFVVEGCADMEVRNGHMTRDGDEMLVRCNSSSVSFRLTCHDSQWRGDTLECHKVPPTKSMHILESTKHHTGSQNHGVLIVIGLGVAIGVAFGVFVLFAIVLCHKRKRARSCLTTTGLFLNNDTLDGQRNFFTSTDHHHHHHQQQQHNNAIYFRSNNNNSNGNDVMISSDISKSCDHLHHHHHHLQHEDPLQQNGESNYCRHQSGDLGQACDPDLCRHASLLVTLDQTSSSRRRQSMTPNHPADMLLPDSVDLKDDDVKPADALVCGGEAGDEKCNEACDAGGIFRNNTRNRNQPTGSPFRSAAHPQLTRSFSPDGHVYSHQPTHYLSTHHHHHHRLHPRNHHHHQEHELTDSNSQLLLLGNDSYQQYHLDDEDDAVVIGNGSVTSEKL